MQDQNAFGTSPTDSSSSVEVADALFCEHGKEVCQTCDFDGREDNDAQFGFNPAPRAPLELPAYTRSPKDGSIHCKQHGNSDCKQCFGWKKQITKLHKDGKKNAKANKNKPESNLHV